MLTHTGDLPMKSAQWLRAIPGPGSLHTSCHRLPAVFHPNGWCSWLSPQRIACPMPGAGVEVASGSIARPPATGNRRGSWAEGSDHSQAGPPSTPGRRLAPRKSRAHVLGLHLPYAPLPSASAEAQARRPERCCYHSWFSFLLRQRTICWFTP